MTTTTEKHFNEAMMDIYRRARTEAGYTASLFHQMLIKYGGLGTAQRLLADTNVSDGYTALYLKGALHLTVEAVIFDNAEFHQLFSDDEMAVVRNRLVEYQYAPAVT